jgi:hypothetical protein
MLLSSRGLRNIVCDDSAFIFKVTGREFEVSRFKAQFLSPAVSHSLCVDATQSSFEIEIPDGTSAFESILSLCDGNSVSVDRSQVFEFGEVCRALGNDELIGLAMGTLEVSICNVGRRLALAITDSDIGFACENFVSLDHSWLPGSVLETLLSDDRLKIDSEDSLLQVVEDRISSDPSLIRLLDYIRCEYLSSEAMSRYISLISIESMSLSVWESLCCRLQLPVSLSPEQPHFNSQFIPLDRSRPFDGIFAHLSRQCGKNPHRAGLIAISANDELPNCPCHDLISPQLNGGTSWTTNCGTFDHYVKIDLKDMLLVPSGYSVKTYSRTQCGKNCAVRSWRFEGSNTNDSRWEVLDRHRDSDLMMEHGKEVSFAISTTTKFRFLRFIQTGTNSSGDGQLCLQRLEVFGLLSRNRQ